LRQAKKEVHNLFFIKKCLYFGIKREFCRDHILKNRKAGIFARLL
jgi:hypothetical protein